MTKHALLAPGGVLGRADNRQPSKGGATPEASGSRHVPERRCRLPARASARGFEFAPRAVAAPRPRARCPTRCSRWSHVAVSLASASMRAGLVTSDADHGRARMATSGTFRSSPTATAQSASGPSTSIVPAPKASDAITHTMRWDCAESPRAKRTATCRGATGSILRVRPRASGGVASRTHLNGRDEHRGGGQPPLPAPPAPIDAPGGRWRSSQGRARRRRSWRSRRRARR